MRPWTGDLTVFAVATEGSNVRVDLVDRVGGASEERGEPAGGDDAHRGSA